MTFVEALRLARPLIESGKERFICDALSTVVPSAYGAAAHRDRIRRYLDGCINYEQWLYIHHYEIYSMMIHRHFRAGRLQWIDYMIAEGEA